MRSAVFLDILCNHTEPDKVPAAREASLCSSRCFRFFFFYKCSRISRRILFATFTVHLENLWGNEVRIAFPYHLNDSIPFNIIKICWAWISLSLYTVILKFYVYLVMFNFFMNLFGDFSARWFFLMPAITRFLVMLDTSKI